MTSCFAKSAATTDAEICIDSSAVSAAQVRGDADQLARVVRNLLDNAVRHARTNVVVTLTENDACCDPHHHRRRPRDTGRALREHVFERFTRLDPARAADHGGTGLGLAIVRAIVEGHMGATYVDPEHHPGARLVVHLPANPPHEGDSDQRRHA